jgi:integrase/recombinase XerD
VLTVSSRTDPDTGHPPRTGTLTTDDANPPLHANKERRRTLPPAVGRAIDRATGSRTRGPVLLNSRGIRMDRHAATRRLRHLATTAGIHVTRAHPHMLRHTFVTTMLDTGVDLRDVQIAARHADPRTTMRYDRARQNLDRHPNYILAAYMASGT